MDDKDSLGYRIKKAREKLRFTQKEAAARLGIHNSTLGKYELGEREPDIATIKKIAEFYEISPIWVAFGEEELIAGPDAKGDQDKIDLIKEEAATLGLSPDDPAFQQILRSAIQFIRIARGENPD